MTADDLAAINVLLFEHEDDLSEWEGDFLFSISEREHLTEKQREKLNQIWERVMVK